MQSPGVRLFWVCRLVSAQSPSSSHARKRNAVSYTCVTMATLGYCGHVKRKAAEILGVSLKTLYNRLEAYNGKEGSKGDVDPSDAAEVARESARG